MFDVPILITIHSRPDKTKQVFERVMKIKPTNLYVAADGPRKSIEKDIENCREARKVFEDINWDCTVKTLYRKENLGCRKAMSQAISWFYSEVEAGIVLEDDCLPHEDFFYFCQELLNRYAENHNINVIAGNNFQKKIAGNQYSYYFSRYIHCWGWASWRRAWEEYDNSMSMWPEMKSQNKLAVILDKKYQINYWTDIFDSVYEGKIDSWAYVWMYTCWKNNKITVIPNVNLVSNIGFDDDATHTKGKNNNLVSNAKKIEFPLKHPGSIEVDRLADNRTEKVLYSGPIFKRFIRMIKKILNY